MIHDHDRAKMSLLRNDDHDDRNRRDTQQSLDARSSNVHRHHRRRFHNRRRHRRRDP